MSLNFTVQKLEEYQGLPDGVYTAQVDHIEYMQGDYGNFHIVNWKILSPSEFEGRIHQERFSVEHSNEDVRRIAINNFSRFCFEIGGCKEGDEPVEGDFLYKVASIAIRNKEGKDGKRYANVIRRSLLERVGNGSKRETAQSILNAHEVEQIGQNDGMLSSPETTRKILEKAGIQLPVDPGLSSAPLNDAVPF